MLLVGILMIGCSGDVKPEDNDPNGNTSTEDLGCDSDDECGTGTICEAEECIDGDRNNSAEEAETLLWDDSITATLNPSGDKDYYTFTARGGEYIRLATTTSLESGDTVMVLREPTGQVVTWSDDFPTGSAVTSLDSVIYAYLAYEGEYLITIEDYASYYNSGEGFGSPMYEYELSLSSWGNVTSEPDGFADANFTSEVDTTSMWSSIGVHIQSESDSDYIQIEYSAKTEDGDDAKFLYVNGIVNLDGSQLTPQVRLLDSENNILSDFINLGPEGQLLYPNMSEGTYYLEIKDASDGGGDNYWTYVFLLARDYTPYPIEVESNDTSEDANAVDMALLQTDGGSDYIVGKYFGDLILPNDIDWFSFSHDYSDGYIIVCLNSALYGSTALPTVELYDENLTLITEATASDSDDPNLAIKEQISETGTYYFSIADSEGLSSDWYHFLVYSTDFDPTSYSCP
jgi:hypothetical protein